MCSSLTLSPRARLSTVPFGAEAPTLAHRPSPAERLLRSAAICAGIIAIAVASSPDCLHWFLIPLFGCGVICCFDGLLLFSNDGRNLCQPVPLVGAFGVYFFLVAPIIHVATDYWFTSEMWAPKDLPGDWRPWLGLMALFNLIGLGIYKLSYRKFTRMFLRRQPSVLQINLRDLKVYGPVLCAIVLVLQVYVYCLFGGIGGFVETFGSGAKGQVSGFSGLGWLFALAESFPVLFVIVCSVLFRKHLRSVRPLTLVIYISGLFVLTLLCGGLRGSRGNTLYTVAYILGITHVIVRPISRKVLVMCGCVFLLFMYVYGFYKANPELLSDPASLFDTIISPDSRSDLESRTHRSLKGVFMGDLDRADLQAYMLFRMIGQGSGAKLAYGRTYIEGALCLIPYGLFQYRPPGKLKYGTDAVFGEGTFSPTVFSTKIYGVAGEAMLNFGPYSAPLGFILLAVLVGYARSLSRSLSSRLDARRFWVPLISIACIVCVSNDLDNVLALLLQHYLLPFILVRMCSSRAVQRGGLSAQRGQQEYVWK